MQNPFVLTFGKNPPEAIPRAVQTAEVLDAFRAEVPSLQVFVITGVRGVGKTVLMTEVANTLKADKDWIVLELNPAADILHSMAAKLCSNDQCLEIFRAAKLNLSLFGVELELSNTPPIVDSETAVTRMLESLKKRGKRVLIAIDEVTNTQDMRVFAGAFQIFVRQDLPVYLLMTGLYENVDNLQNEKNLTFLYRAPKINLPPLNMGAIAGRYAEVFQLDRNKAKEMATLTDGYPFAFQVLGYLTWENGGDYTAILDKYRLYLEEFVYDKLWSETSAKDKAVLHAIAMVPDGKVRTIRDKLGMETNEFNPYRKRLIRKGLVNGDTYGYVRFMLPFFADYVIDNF